MGEFLTLCMCKWHSTGRGVLWLLCYGYNIQETKSLLSVGIIVIASAIIVRGWMIFLNNSVHEQFGDFAISRFGTSATDSGLYFILVRHENI